jgi:hypothetical protein
LKKKSLHLLNTYMHIFKQAENAYTDLKIKIKLAGISRFNP